MNNIKNLLIGVYYEEQITIFGNRKIALLEGHYNGRTGESWLVTKRKIRVANIVESNEKIEELQRAGYKPSSEFLITVAETYVMVSKIKREIRSQY